MLDCWKDLTSLTGRLHELCAVAPELAGQLTLAQTRVVKIIYMRAPEPVILKDVAQELAITPSAVSQMVDVLVKQDLVERLPSPTDRRAVILRPTARGERFRREHNRKVAALMRRLGSTVAAQDTMIFASVLARLRAEADALWQRRRNELAEPNAAASEPTSQPRQSNRNNS